MLLASVQRTIISLFGNAASTVVALAALLALLPACAFQSKPRSSDLEAPLLSPNDDSAEEFRERFISLLDDETNRLRTRVGLVPNYFMTRGEDTERLFESRKSFLHTLYSHHPLYGLCNTHCRYVARRHSSLYGERHRPWFPHGEQCTVCPLQFPCHRRLGCISH